MENQESNIEDTIPSDLKERYVDFKFVGQGGMGQIISAHDTSLDKRVAIKVLPSKTLSDTAVVRFHQEAKAVSKLNHKHIVQVLDFGFASTGEPYLVMEYVAGETLESLIEKNKTLPLRTVASLAIQICSGLQHAHANKIIHRDLKPANIMLDENNVVKILDFGLAKIMDQENIDWRLTRPGQAIGSPLYMSPEQLRGENLDERTDVYSLGLVLFKMITGTVPFEGENIMRILMGRMQDAPPVLPPDTETPLLTQALSDVITGALQTSLDDRTSSMSEMKDALIETESIVDVKELPAEEPNWFKAKLFTKTMLIVLSAVAGIVIMYGAFFVFSHRVSNATNSQHDKFGELKWNSYGFEKYDDDSADALNKSPDLTVLWVAQSNLEDEDLKRLIGHNITKLSLQTNTNFTIEGMKSVSKLPLTKLVLRDTHLGDEAIPYINELVHLQSLDLRGCKVTDKGIKQLKPSKLLRYLSLAYLNGVTDAALPLIVQKFPNLNHLNLSSCAVTPKGLKQLKPLSLTSLDVTALKVTDADMDTIVMLHPLYIALEENPMSDNGLEKLKKLKTIRKLNVEFCKQISEKKLDEFRAKYPGILIISPLKAGAQEKLKEIELNLKEPEKL